MPKNLDMHREKADRGDTPRRLQAGIEIQLTCLKMRVSVASSALSLHLSASAYLQVRPQIPTFGGNETMRPNCGGSEKMRPLGYQRGDKANTLRRLEYRLDQTMLQVIPPG